MKALCVNAERKLELREILEPAAAPAEHLLIELDSSAINHGDKFFLTSPGLLSLPSRRYDVYGASGAGRVIALGDGAPTRYLGRQVALYRSLNNTPDMLGLWSEKVIVPPTACVILPDAVRARDYCGSLVNAITACAFLEQVRDEGHKGVIVTAGNAGTGRALLALALARGVPALFLARSTEAREELLRLGAKHALSTADENFDRDFTALSQSLNATAIFDGVGGALVSRLVPLVPRNAAFYFFGFLGGPTPVSVQTVLFMSMNLTMKRFSNFESATVKDPTRLVSALRDIEGLIADPLFRTNIGREFGFEDIEEALRYTSAGGAKAVLVS
jgi:NADPH:quinone reductase-like Zn-dependent oxidoreductase